MVQPEVRPQPYDRHVGRYGPRLAAELISATGIARGQRAGRRICGFGALTIELARVLGETSVAAIDPSESAVETCRVRVSEAEVIVAPVENLPFDDREFDAALAQLAIDLVDDPAAGTREMRRVVRRGGVVAACVWDATAMPLLSSFWEAAAEIAPDEVGIDGVTIWPRVSALLSDGERPATDRLRPRPDRGRRGAPHAAGARGLAVRSQRRGGLTARSGPPRTGCGCRTWRSPG